MRRESTGRPTAAELSSIIGHAFGWMRGDARVPKQQQRQVNTMIAVVDVGDHLVVFELATRRPITACLGDDRGLIVARGRLDDLALVAEPAKEHLESAVAVARLRSRRG